MQRDGEVVSGVYEETLTAAPSGRERRMIKGLRFKLTASELKERLTKRAAHHTERANEKEAELPNLKSSLELLLVLLHHLDPDEPVKELEQDIRHHRNSAVSFLYMAEHLFEEDYDLDENDLIRLEILRRN